MGSVVSPIGDVLGFGPRGVNSFTPDNRLAVNMMEDNQAGRSESMQQAVRDYLNKSGNYAQGGLGLGGTSRTEREVMAEDPLAGSRMASDEVFNSPLGQSLVANQGLSDKMSQSLFDEQRNLANQGYKLSTDDMTSYGQAQGDIERMFGQQANDLQSELAKRGLASGASGAAGAQFSGLLGNKYEQLARASSDMAQRRYQDTTNRLNQARQQLGQFQQLGQSGFQQGQGAIQNQYNRQLGGAQSRRDYLNSANNAMTGANQMNYQALEDARNNKPQTIGDAFAGGLFGGMQNTGYKIGAMPGNYATTGSASGSSFGGGK